MKVIPAILGVVLIAAGGLSLAADGASGTTEEPFASIGPSGAPPETTEEVSLPMVLGGALVTAGVITVLATSRAIQRRS